MHGNQPTSAWLHESQVGFVLSKGWLFRQVKPIFHVLFITPTKNNMEPENTPFGKGETSTNHQFLGSILVFKGV